MKRIPVLLALFFLCFYIVKADTTEDCSQFETKKNDKCVDLSYGSKVCYYDSGECKERFKDCSDYEPQNNADTICAKIIPNKEINDMYKKCILDKDSNDKVICKKVYKTCEDLNESDCGRYTSSNLNLESGARCVFHNRQCKLHYNSCNNDKLDNTKCASNIPSDNTKRCYWDESSCKEADRKCSDYIVYAGYGERNQECHLLSHESPKICYFNGLSCIETYKACGDYVSTDTSTSCINIQPLYEITTGSGKYRENYLYKCVEEGSLCTLKKKTCSEYKDYYGIYCSSYQSAKDTTNTKAKCLMDDEDDTCKDMYLKCEYYNDLVTDSSKRTSAECTSITARKENIYNELEINDHYTCSFKPNDNNKCITELKECSQIKEKSTCNSHYTLLSDKNKKCIYKDTCKEEFLNCDTYNSYHSSDKSKILKSDCEAITPIYTDNKQYKCVYKEDTSGRSCERQELKKCEDYSGNDEDICKILPVNDTYLYQCKMIDNHCVTQYSNCSAYDYHISNTNKIPYKNICESIDINSVIDRCFLEEDRTCTRKTKLCSEYKEENGRSCSSYRALDTGKSCALENGKCIEKEITKDYKYCSDYRGTDISFCESIQPYYYNSVNPDYSFRCVYGEKGCEKLPKKCEEAKDNVECQNIIPSDTDKICVFKDRCVEQYKDCSTYESKEDTLNKNTCESILIQGRAETYKCVFTAGTGSSKGSCTEQRRECSDFKVETILDQCSNIDFTTKKCRYSNNGCNLVDKTCLDLYNNSYSVDDEICGAAATSSSNKKCVKNTSGSGCREVDKTEEEKKKEQSGHLIVDHFFISLIIILLGF